MIMNILKAIYRAFITRESINERDIFVLDVEKAEEGPFSNIEDSKVKVFSTTFGSVNYGGYNNSIHWPEGRLSKTRFRLNFKKVSKTPLCQQKMHKKSKWPCLEICGEMCELYPNRCLKKEKK